MSIKRKKWTLRKGEVIEVEENHSGRYGAPGEPRAKRNKATPEQIEKVNRANKIKRCRRKMIQYFRDGDLWATWTYSPDCRPPDMSTALKDFQKAMRVVRKEYKKRGQELRWIRNIEKGTKGAWHIHLLINEIGETASIIQKAWVNGGTWSTTLANSKFYDEDFTQLASYITKDENTREKNKGGGKSKPRIAEANYGCSRNMPIPEPQKDELKRWKKEIKPKKGYYISKIREGINPITGYRYRSYTMIKLKGGGNSASEHIRISRQQRSKKE